MSRSYNFDNHWKRFGHYNVPHSKKTEAAAFLKPLFSVTDRFNGIPEILDVGCGDGIHAVALAEKIKTPVHFTGVDISREALLMAQQRTGNHPASQQFRFDEGTVLSLPYKDNSFDVVFSYGVLSYTGNIQQGIREMVRVCKTGGMIGLWVFPDMKGPLKILFNATRTLCKIPVISHLVINGIVVALPFLPLRSGVNLGNATWKQCAEVVAVNILPDVLEMTKLDDMLKLFERYKVKIVTIDDERPITVWGQKTK